MDTPSPAPSSWSAYSRTVFIAFAAIAAVLIAYEHRLHLLGLLPWLFLLACPLMHLFMHHGHGHHGRHPGADSPAPKSTEAPDA